MYSNYQEHSGYLLILLTEYVIRYLVQGGEYWLQPMLQLISKRFSCLIENISFDFSMHSILHVIRKGYISQNYLYFNTDALIHSCISPFCKLSAIHSIKYIVLRALFLVMNLWVPFWCSWSIQPCHLGLRHSHCTPKVWFVILVISVGYLCHIRFWRLRPAPSHFVWSVEAPVDPIQTVLRSDYHDVYRGYFVQQRNCWGFGAGYL